MAQPKKTCKLSSPFSNTPGGKKREEDEREGELKRTKAKESIAERQKQKQEDQIWKEGRRESMKSTAAGRET